MSVLTVYADTADQDLTSTAAAYENAMHGVSLVTSGGASTVPVGQDTGGGTSTVYETFLSFDTSSIPDSATVSQVDLSTWLTTDSSTTDFTVEARTYDWGSTVTSADWIGTPNPQFIQSFPWTDTATNHTSPDISGSVQAGDLIVLLFRPTALIANSSPPAGFSLANEDNEGTSGTYSVSMWYKVAAGTETTITPTTSSSVYAEGNIFIFRGMAASPFDLATVTDVTGTGTSMALNLLSATGTPADSVFVAMLGTDVAVTAEAIDSSFTIRNTATLTMLLTAYKMTTGVAAPTFSWTTSANRNAVQGTFKASRVFPTLTRLATLATSGIGATGAYKTFTEDGTNFRSAIDLTGTTRFALLSSRTVSQTAPSGAEYVVFSSADEAGTTQDPKLVVTYGTIVDAALVLGAPAEITATALATRDRSLILGAPGDIKIVSSGAIREAALTLAAAAELAALGATRIREAALTLGAPGDISITALDRTRDRTLILDAAASLLLTPTVAYQRTLTLGGVSSIAVTATAFTVHRSRYLTADDILDGRQGNGTVAIRCEVLDADGNSAGFEIHPSTTGTVQFNPSNRIPRTWSGVRLTPTDAALLVPGVHRLRPVWVLPGVGYEQPLGVFLYLGGDEVEQAGGTWMECSPFPDRLHQADQDLEDPFGVAPSALLTDSAVEVLELAGIFDYTIVPSSLRNGSTPLVGEKGLDVLDQIADLLGYLPPYTDNTGQVILRPVPSPLDDAPDHVYNRYGQTSRVFADSIRTTRSVAARPNVYRYRSNAPTATDVTAKLEIPASEENSKAKTGYAIVDTTEVDGVTDSTQALDILRAKARRASAVPAVYRWSGPPDPRHDGWGIVELDWAPSRLLEQSWDLPLVPGGPHSHVATNVYADA